MNQDEEELFSEADLVFSYTDEQAVEDGVLIPFIAGGRDTGHRITGNLYHDLKGHYKGYDYDDPEYLRFFLNELLPLVPYALKEWDRKGMLTSDYDFKAGKPQGEKVIWYVPNEVNGITMMKPEDW
jgi:hypothetical protein